MRRPRRSPRPRDREGRAEQTRGREHGIRPRTDTPRRRRSSFQISAGGARNSPRTIDGTNFREDRAIRLRHRRSASDRNRRRRLSGRESRGGPRPIAMITTSSLWHYEASILSGTHRPFGRAPMTARRFCPQPFPRPSTSSRACRGPSHSRQQCPLVGPATERKAATEA